MIWSPWSYCLRPLRASAAALSLSSVMRLAWAASLCRWPLSALIALPFELLSLTGDNFSRDCRVLEGGVPVGKAPPLLLPLLGRGLNPLRAFEQFGQCFAHVRVSLSAVPCFA